MHLLTRIARSAGYERAASEHDLAVVPLAGFDGHPSVAPFKMMVDQFLETSIPTHVILDRDYRPETVCRQLEAEFRAAGIDCHVWHKKEIESYLLVPSVLARVCELAEDDVEAELAAIVDGLESVVFARSLSEVQSERVSARRHRVSVIEEFKPRFDAEWADAEARRSRVPPKDVLRLLNSWVTSHGGTSLSFRKLAGEIRRDEIDGEVMDVLEELERSLAPSGSARL